MLRSRSSAKFILGNKSEVSVSYLSTLAYKHVVVGPVRFRADLHKSLHTACMDSLIIKLILREDKFFIQGNLC